MANEFIDVNEIITDINTVMVENQDGNISAEDMNAFLIDIANRLKVTRQHLTFVTGLTGGSDNYLDAIDARDFDAGEIISVIIDGRIFEYELVVSSDAEFLPYIIRPDVYEDMLWKRRDVLAGTFDNGDLVDNKLTVTHKALTKYIQVWIYDDNDDIVHDKPWSPGADPDQYTKTVIDFGGEITGTYKYVLRW